MSTEPLSFADGIATAAAGYLARGLSVIALSGKTPNVSMHKRGLHDALSGAPEDVQDFIFIRKFFHHPDTTGVGIVIPYPYVVVDIDGEEGAQQWQGIVGEQFGADTTWVAATPRLPAGGLHVWYFCPTATGSIKLGSKLDLKGQASYVAAPPSLHPDGGTYQWLIGPDLCDPLEAPDALRRIIEDHAFDLKQRMAAKTIFKQRFGPPYKEGDTVFYAQANHDALIAGMSTAEDGNRNNYLHWAAATLAEENGSEEEFEALDAAALAAGLEPVEVRRTLRSARRAHG